MTIDVQTLLDDMQLSNTYDVPGKTLPGGGSLVSLPPAGIVQGIMRGDAAAAWVYTVSGGIFAPYMKPTIFWSRVRPWWVLFPTSDNNDANTRVAIRKIEAYILRTNGVWDASPRYFEPGTNQWADTYTTPNVDNTSGRPEADDGGGASRSFRVNNGNTLFIHGGGLVGDYTDASPATVAAVHVRLEAKLIVNNSGLPFDTSGTFRLMEVGCEFLPSNPQGWPYNPGLGTSRTRLITSSWQTFTLTTVVPDSKGPNNPIVPYNASLNNYQNALGAKAFITETELRNNPPPGVGLSGTPGVVSVDGSFVTNNGTSPNLTTIGTGGWMALGQTGTGSIDKKSTGTNPSDPSWTGTPSTSTTGSKGVKPLWTDGTPTASKTTTTINSIGVVGVGNGYSFTENINNTTKQIIVHFKLYNGTAVLTASLNDPSGTSINLSFSTAASTVETRAAVINVTTDGNYNLTISHPITAVIDLAGGGSPSLGLQAVTVAGTVAIPNVSGETTATAHSDVTTAGFVVGTDTNEESNTYNIGDTIRTSPTGYAASGATIDFVNSIGTLIPDLQTTHVNWLATGAALFATKNVAYTLAYSTSGTYAAGLVISQSAGVGGTTYVDPNDTGSPVTITISMGANTPSIDSFSDIDATELSEVTFIVHATTTGDPADLVLSLSGDAYDDGAYINDLGNGDGIGHYTPTLGKAALTPVACTVNCTDGVTPVTFDFNINVAAYVAPTTYSATVSGIKLRNGTIPPDSSDLTISQWLDGDYTSPGQGIIPTNRIAGMGEIVSGSITCDFPQTGTYWVRFERFSTENGEPWAWETEVVVS